MEIFDAIRTHLSQPEYLHTLINPMPVYGLAMGVLALLGALVSRKRAASVVALGLIALSGASAVPTYVYGEQGYDRMVSIADETGGKWLDAHKERAEKLIPIFYVLAALALAAIVAPLKWPATALPLALLTLLLGVGTLGAGGYIAMAGGQVRHKEFRTYGPPPVTSKESG